MRNAVLIIAVGSVLTVAVSTLGRQSSLYAQFPPAFAESPPAVQSEAGPVTGELIALSSDTAEGQQQVTVIDPQSRVMSVYHINHSAGTITLKSVRNIRADLQMDEYNTDSPLPREIRAILKQR